MRLEKRKPKLYTLPPHTHTKERERESERKKKGKKYLLKGEFNPKRKISHLGFYLDHLTVLSHDETRERRASVRYRNENVPKANFRCEPVPP